MTLGMFLLAFIINKEFIHSFNSPARKLAENIGFSAWGTPENARKYRILCKFIVHFICGKMPLFLPCLFYEIYNREIQNVISPIL